MKTFFDPPRAEWPEILKRPASSSNNVDENVRTILDAVKKNGDEALKKFTREFDKAEINELRVSQQEFDEASGFVSAELKAAIKQAFINIVVFHQSQVREESPVLISRGVTCWRKSIPIERVGLYIPGGSAPLFSSVLMLGIPAALAGCQDVILCTPPSADGKVNPIILYVAQACGIKKIFKVGGAQAIAAMAYGTETVPRVKKIFGPGNAYVTAAKRIVAGEDVAIDMPAGPSEVLVLADASCNAAYVASDLLAQAEHGPDSQVILVTSNEKIVDQVRHEIKKQLPALPRKEIAEQTLLNSKAFVMRNLADGMDLSNFYAPEHLILAVDLPLAFAEKVVNAGSVFLGHYSPESAGDYASGTNHTLPTNGFAKQFSGVSVDSFVKKVTMQQLTKEGLETLSASIVSMAEAEGLEAHARSVKIRFEQ